MHKEKVFLWGTGAVATDVMTSFEFFIYQNYEVLGFIDSNPQKQGKYFFRKMIYSPMVLMIIQYDKIIILSDSLNEIKGLAVDAYFCEEHKIQDKSFLIQHALMERYAHSSDTEIREIINNIHQRGLKIFNYEYIDEYKGRHTKVFKDDTCGLFYVVHNDKRLYFKRDFTNEHAVDEYYFSLLCEQDKRSPHCYVTEDFNVEKGDVVVDAGAAEGIFALEHIDKISKLYLIETEKSWVEALKKTFAPYIEKTIFIEKYLCDADYGAYATLDNIIKEEVNFIKMDIEGNEWDALRGGAKLFRNSNRLRCAICCYHTDYDEYLICNLLKEYEMEFTLSNGYMWFPYKTKNRLISDRLHRGVARGEKKLP